MKLQSKILLIALIRTVLLWVILTGLGSYKLELLTQKSMQTDISGFFF